MQTTSGLKRYEVRFRNRDTGIHVVTVKVWAANESNAKLWATNKARRKYDYIGDWQVYDIRELAPWEDL